MTPAYATVVEQNKKGVGKWAKACSHSREEGIWTRN